MSPVSDPEVSSEPGTGGRGREAAPSREDCLCPVCLEIFTEPVTLPCTHTFCKVCFLESVDKATLCCPVCRKRVSTWARLHSRNNTLVNEQLWRQIQTCFPRQCGRGFSGQDEAEDPHSALVFFRRVSEPGELRQEYEDHISKLTEEKRVLEEEQRKASEEYIQRLLAEEEQLVQEDSKRREEDERLARLLSNQLNSAPVSEENLHPAAVTSVKKKRRKEDVSMGHIDKFLCPRMAPPSSTFSSASGCVFNKENILLSEVEVPMERPLPRLDYYGHQSALHTPEEAEERQLGRQGIRHGGPSSGKRKSSELEATEVAEEASTKRGCQLLDSSSTLQEVAEWELQDRRRQEEEDRRLALLLQKQLDQEEKQQATDRRKGSADAYQLRGTKEEARTPITPGKASRRAPKTCTTPSCSSKTSVSSSPSTSTLKPSSERGRKQTLLTEMFSTLSS